MALKLKKFNIVIVGVVLIVLIIAAVVIKGVGGKKAAVEPEDAPSPTEILPTIDASVNVDLTFSSDKKHMTLSISNLPDKITSIDYELSYVTGEGIPKGNIGEIRLSGEKSVTRSGEELTLGTCSRGKCVYYDGITTVSLSLKFHKEDGSSGIFQKDYSI